MRVSSKTRMPWRVKLERPSTPRIVSVPPRLAKTIGRGRMLIATPKLIQALVHKVPSGRLTTVTQIMHRLAKDHDCDVTCPLTTGIFLRIVAEVAEENLAAGQRRVAPYWRVLKSDGSLNDKYPGGTERQAARLRAEGFQIDITKKTPRVRDFQAVLVEVDS